MLYYVYKLNEDGSKDRLHITNDADVAGHCKEYQEKTLGCTVIIETEKLLDIFKP